MMNIKYDSNMKDISPFYFHTRVTQVRLLGKNAKNVRQLLEGMRKVPEACIYYHTHRFLEQHRYFSPEHPNDFSYWITTSLGLKKLGEHIASVDLFRFRDIESLRRVFIEALEKYLKDTSFLRNCLEGEEFKFISSRTFIFPTQFNAHNLNQFAASLEKITIHSIYYHMFEARMRLQKSDNDFSHWLRGMGYLKLAEQISCLDPYTYTLEGLRKKIIRLVREVL